MSGSTVAKRYALALFQLANEHQLLGQMEEDLRIVKDVVNNNKGLDAVLKSPKLENDEKKGIIKTAFASVNPLVLNTLMLLIDRHREDQFSDLAEEFISLANDARGIAEAKVYSVRPLTEAESSELSAAFASRVGKTSLRIENIVDPGLLGGIKLRIGNRIFDGSMRGKLERLERQLLS
ncbi:MULTISPECIES: F0F1 ATP synthase subunit delta [Bacillaceae]|jgi:F-type H+-transporting ATPase subunit delta|uniref:ATP synthase subunit delta n=2 Tax=Bacillus infantis TaxID=324767 RepID=U5LGH5_9BACI|nr:MULTISPECIES: F0F1 ATP synthase subunit delta [Bacillus]OXT16032.1 F0F1 ATP synthase subunit delta [Bacillus sp. OG2]AGX06580.1 F0F1 ATP synthase subunit delta [Bacillus infantis NRRL B-14911]EAR68480.1 F0F1 ATP synthase subunit delta [Bacillus sp. NRRL B-14911]MCA1033401.1 F0F1 ATP synthase subunit delta [Bacillus infantis]MCA1040266.1 F0F1 ATP synthase subunit delta [Bacillus infantis]